MNFRKHLRKLYLRIPILGDHFGASLTAYEQLGHTLGYSLVGCDLAGLNAFFVRNDLLADHFTAPFTSSNHYEPARYTLRHRNGHPLDLLDRAPRPFSDSKD